MEEKKVDLEGIFYDENGDFIPQTASNGNIDGNLSLLRDTYMEAEREYFEALLSRRSILEEFEQLFNEHSDSLFEAAMYLQEKLEYGELETPEEKSQMETMTQEERDKFHMDKLEKTEGIICLLLAAARDKVKVLELVKTMDARNSRTL